MAGVVVTGFQKKTLEEIKTEIETSLKSSLGPSINLQADSLLGNLVGILSSREAEMLELAQAVYGSSYPDSASGVPLDNVAAITGAVRLPQTQTLMLDVQLLGTNGTSVPAGSVIVNLAGERFQIVGGPFVIGFAPNPAFRAEKFGAVPVGAGHTIATPVAGWTGVFDDSTPAPVLGRTVETDAAFRLRRVLLLSRAGDATVAAIRADVLSVPGVFEVAVFENTSMVTDINGVTAKSIEVIVDDVGTSLVQNNALAQAIYDSKAAGILAHGAVFGTAIDVFNNEMPVRFTRVSVRTTTVTVNVEVVAALWPADGPQQVRDRITAANSGLKIGQDLFRTRLFSLPYQVSGVQNVSVLTLSGANGAGDLDVSIRQKAFIIGVIVNVTFVSPT